MMRAVCEPTFEVAQHLVGHIDDSASRGFFTAQAPSDRKRFAGHDARNGVANLLAVRVHHPCHDLSVGPNIWGWDILVRANQWENLRGVSPCQPL
jgi:hypothetical protein